MNNTKPFFKFIDNRFYWQPLIKQAVEERRKKIGRTERLPYVIIPGKYWKVKVDKPEQVLAAIDAIYEMYDIDSEGGILIRARYVEKEKPDATISKLHITKQTYYNWLHTIISVAAIDFVKREIVDFRNLKF